jgi:hypothetical protein
VRISGRWCGGGREGLFINLLLIICYDACMLPLQPKLPLDTAYMPFQPSGHAAALTGSSRPPPGDWSRGGSAAGKKTGKPTYICASSQKQGRTLLGFYF